MKRRKGKTYQHWFELVGSYFPREPVQGFKRHW
jgi:hypothetical protein